MPGLARVLAQQLQPVGLVAAFGFGEGQKDGALFAGAVLGEVTVDGSLGAFVGEVLAPALDVRCGGSGRGAAALDAAASAARRAEADALPVVWGSDFAC